MTMSVEYTGFPITKRQHNAVNKWSYKQSGKLWHSTYREKHFTQQGAREYRYAFRSKAYMKAKKEAKGHRRPLEWSGTSRMLAGIRDIRSTAKAGRVFINAPALNFRPRRKNGVAINMREEMTTVSDREQKKMGDTFGVEYTRRIKSLRHKSRKTIR
jgi:hypothetical protein